MSDFERLGKQIGEVDAMMDVWIAKLGLNYNSFAVLYALASAENGQCTQKQICEAWLLPTQTVFNVCKEYKAKGWIEFYPSMSDKRERIMRLTPIGIIKAKSVWGATRQLSQQTFGIFGEHKTEQLFALLAEFCKVYRQQIDNTNVE